MATDEEDPAMVVALARYQIVTAYLTLDPPRGQRGLIRKQLAAKTWFRTDGQRMSVKSISHTCRVQPPVFFGHSTVNLVYR